MANTATKATKATRKTVERLLIVEDNLHLQRTLASVFQKRAGAVRGVGTVAAAREALTTWRPDVVVLDFALPDGDAFDVLVDVSALEPLPALIAISGTAAPGDTFRLAQRGVRAFVETPIELELLEDALEQALAHPPILAPLLRATVGHVGVREMEEQVRETMVAEALARTAGSRKGAARLLSVSRQLLQHILKRDG